MMSMLSATPIRSTCLRMRSASKYSGCCSSSRTCIKATNVWLHASKPVVVFCVRSSAELHGAVHPCFLTSCWVLAAPLPGFLNELGELRAKNNYCYQEKLGLSVGTQAAALMQSDAKSCEYATVTWRLAENRQRKSEDKAMPNSSSAAARSNSRSKSDKWQAIGDFRRIPAGFEAL